MTVVLLGCEPTTERLPGHLALVEVVTTSDDCSPRRFSGDAGQQFFGVRDDGGVVFTISQLAQYGPARDGGVLEGSGRQAIPVIAPVNMSVAAGDACVGRFGSWVLDGPTSLTITQTWPGISDCTAGPTWLPAAPCTSVRTFSFTALSDCRLECVTLSASLEVSCSC
ncbi:MAG: hypothetical protein U0228_34145 [Myxococcaceae bacterium]